MPTYTKCEPRSNVTLFIVETRGRAIFGETVTVSVRLAGDLVPDVFSRNRYVPWKGGWEDRRPG